MPDYKKMYCKLFGAVTKAITILQEAQQETEEIYIVRISGYSRTENQKEK